MVKFRKIEGNEFSRLLSTEQLGLLPLSVEISADGQERAGLARRFALLDLAALTANLMVEAAGRQGAILVRGRLAALAVQACVVTLAPLEARLSEAFEMVF